MKRVYQPTKKKTILIVDDDHEFIETLRDKFQQQGLRVESARNPDRALERLREERVDCLLIDLCLPGVSAAEVLKSIRAEFDREALPIIAFSNILLGNMARIAAEMGATRCYTKTDISPEQLSAVVRQLLVNPCAVEGEKLVETVSGADETTNLADSEFRERLKATFSIHGPQALAALRSGCQAFASAQEADARQAELSEMHHHCRSLSASAGPLGFRKITQMANALEALFIEARAKPQKITQSVTRTILEAIDTLGSLFGESGNPHNDSSVPSRILVVDDEIISREAVCSALRKASLEAVSLDDPVAAGGLLETDHFDLVFLDVEMPGLSGLDLCAALRKTEANRHTPVVFVTARSDFASWARTSLSGGNDFIGKPFLSVELAVKALSWLFRNKPRRSTSAPPPSALPLTQTPPQVACAASD